MIRTDENTIGFRVRKARGRLGMKQNEFAKLLGVQPSYLSRVERNAGTPSENLLMKVADLTGTAYSWLSLSDISEPHKHQIIIHNDNTDKVKAVIESAYANKHKREIHFTDPIQSNPLSKFGFIPTCWCNLDDGPLENWALVFGDPKALRNGCLPNFISNIVLSNTNIRDCTKYSFVVPSPNIFDIIPRKLSVPIGNVSIIQVDLNSMQVLRELYISTSPSRASRKYLEKDFCFPDISNQQNTSLIKA